jgi:hypothetical protein
MIGPAVSPLSPTPPAAFPALTNALAARVAVICLATALCPAVTFKGSAATKYALGSGLFRADGADNRSRPASSRVVYCQKLRGRPGRKDDTNVDQWSHQTLSPQFDPHAVADESPPSSSSLLAPAPALAQAEAQAQATVVGGSSLAARAARALKSTDETNRTPRVDPLLAPTHGSRLTGSVLPTPLQGIQMSYMDSEPGTN